MLRKVIGQPDLLLKSDATKSIKPGPLHIRIPGPIEARKDASSDRPDLPPADGSQTAPDDDLPNHWSGSPEGFDKSSNGPRSNDSPSSHHGSGSSTNGSLSSASTNHSFVKSDAPSPERPDSSRQPSSPLPSPLNQLPSPEQVSCYRLVTAYNELVQHVTRFILSPSFSSSCGPLIRSFDPPAALTRGELDVLQGLLRRNLERAGWSVTLCELEVLHGELYADRMCILKLGLVAGRQIDRFSEFCEIVKSCAAFGGCE
ncbi:hypothetical protein HKX48_007580 [Thoreauomyces humboldtii]|nr:hypothetical protein HKX48_007580 [Thoreauomyces humboldtii]